MGFDPIKSATEMVKHIRVSSVFGSIMFIMPFLLGSLLVVSFSHNVVVEIFLMFIIGILFLVFILSFLGILLFGDHKELQSEDHIFRMKALEVLGDQSHEFIDHHSSIKRNNPALPDPKNSKIPKPSGNKSLEKTHE